MTSILEGVNGVSDIIGYILVFLLSKYALQALRDFEKQKKEGIKTPVFTKDALSKQDGVTVWDNK